MTRKTRHLLLLGIPVLTIVIGFIAWTYSGRYISTDNAYVKTTQIHLSPEVSGLVQRVVIAENQPVAKGDLLFEIDPAPFQTAVTALYADIEEIRLDIESQRASYQLRKEELKLAEENLAFSRREHQRQSSLSRKGMNSESQLDRAAHEQLVAAQTIGVIREDLKRLLTVLQGNPDLPAEQHPRFVAATAKLHQAELDLANTKITSPIDGVASKLPNSGEYVDIGKAVMTVISNRDPWIEANFMETQLTKVTVGMPVEVTIDSYPDHHWEGKVKSISPATGSEYSILPAQNASGNWVKITQRIPVRISVEMGSNDPVLRKGMTAEVAIDTGTYH